MKTYILLCCCILLRYAATAQKIEPFKDIDDNVRVKIIERVNVLESVIQKSDTALLSDYLSKEFRSGNQNQQNALPPIALAHLPKAHLILTDAAVGDDEINLTLNLSSFLMLLATLDKDYQFKAISISKTPDDFRETGPAFEAAKIIL